MARPFPADEPFLRGYYAPQLAECDAPHLPISGEMPRALNGSLYRNGPNPQFAPRGPYHRFAGDGMLHAFYVADGRVGYRNRWVRTPKWQLENVEGEGLSGSFGNPRFSDPRITALNSSVANTHVVWHAGRLLALEDAQAPIQIDPLSLATLAETRFDGKLQGPMTAHPKIDAQSGEIPQRDLPRPDPMQRPGGVQRARHRRRAGGLGASVPPGAGGVSWQLAAGGGLDLIAAAKRSQNRCFTPPPPR